MATKTKLKTPAADAPQSMAQVQSDIRTIGDLQREHTRLLTELNDYIADRTDKMAPQLKALSEQIIAKQRGVQTWCEVHREEICGKGKTANLVTGEVQWRARPPSVKVTGVDAVLAWLKNMGMLQFVRTKEEINKEAMLNEADKAAKVPGIVIVRDVEDFVIAPFEVEAVGAA